MTSTGGNPWPFYVPTNPFGTFAAFSDSWGIWFKSNFTQKKDKVFKNIFSSHLGNKKLRFVHTTRLARECMWTAHKLTGKMRRSPFQYNRLTLTYNFFHVNRNTFPEFSQILYQQFSTFHSTLVVNYPNQALCECTWVFLTDFCCQHAYWIVSAGPSGHLKQSIQRTVFQQRTTSTRQRASKPKRLFRNCPNIVLTCFL